MTAVPVAPPTPQPRIIGLDISLRATGLSDGVRTWTVTSTGHNDDTLTARTDRLRQLRAEIVSDCEGAELVVVEGPSYGQTSGHSHDRSGLFWLVVMALTHRGIHVAEVPPAVLKRYACGRGNATKGAMIEAAVRRYPHVPTGGDDNRADALFLHALGLDHLTGVHVVPETHRTALGKVRWPAMASDR